ncbi:unnamed protein product [Danaus chrysippus]|uniref:(African queen) hypothetical protein n=1 Tax=Danaus chrysippus TaxID=151541 RepID=A0A8J2R493_9NEOP|nr:unnamed protein product [Danaus chrysippus]
MCKRSSRLPVGGGLTARWVLTAGARGRSTARATAPRTHDIAVRQRPHYSRQCIHWSTWLSRVLVTVMTIDRAHSTHAWNTPGYPRGVYFICTSHNPTAY